MTQPVIIYSEDSTRLDWYKNEFKKEFPVRLESTITNVDQAIDVVKTLNESLNQKEGFIIDFDNSTYITQNKLLLTLEKLDFNQYKILILTSNLSTVLPTIKSRCQINVLAPWDNETLNNFRKENFTHNKYDHIESLECLKLLAAKETTTLSELLDSENKDEVGQIIKWLYPESYGYFAENINGKLNWILAACIEDSND